jgi:hypothetical protein
MRYSLIVLKVMVISIGLLAIAACSKQPATDKTGTPVLKTAEFKPAATGSVAGLEWGIPSGWNLGPQKPMRAATYLIGEGDSQAECAVFYFGAGQGGDIEANITRWISQVKQPDGSDSKDKALRSKIDAPCGEVTTIEIEGTYQASSGPMMQVTAEKPGYMLLGGIAPGGEGNVFFKLTGPKSAVEKIKMDFMSMLGSVKKPTS